MVNPSNLNMEFESSSLRITVGDASTETLLSMGFPPDIEVVDGLEMRKLRDCSNYTRKA